MNTKTCSKCGWVYPINWPGHTCKFCHTKFTYGLCTVCGEWTDNLNKDNQCNVCHAKISKAWHQNRRDTAENKHKEWCDMITKIPTPYKTLTEDEWLAACNHFGGCAYCGTDQIDARAMFIQFKHGGRYCAWNIIPMCDKCAKIHTTMDNPFKRMDAGINRCKNSMAVNYKHDLQKLQKIVDYLRSKLEALI